MFVYYLCWFKIIYIAFIITVNANFIENVDKREVSYAKGCPDLYPTKNFNIEKLPGEYLKVADFVIQNIGPPDSGDFNSTRSVFFGVCVRPTIPPVMSQNQVRFPFLRQGSYYYVFLDVNIGKGTVSGFGPAVNKRMSSFQLRPLQTFFVSVLYQSDEFLALSRCDPSKPIYNQDNTRVHILQSAKHTDARMNKVLEVLKKQGIKPRTFVTYCDPGNDSASSYTSRWKLGASPFYKKPIKRRAVML